MVEVKPCDREAAADMATATELREIIRSGRFDDHPYTQAFAAHREAAIAPLVEMLEEAERALEAVARVEDQYRDQMKFCDIDPLPYFREFTERLRKTEYRATLSKIRGE